MSFRSCTWSVLQVLMIIKKMWLVFLHSEIQLKSPNWLFGQRKYEETGAASKAAQNETENVGQHKDIRVDGYCDLGWLSSVGDTNEEEIFRR